MARHAAFYRSKAWQRARKAQLSAEPLCRFCLEDGRLESATVVDHIVSIEERPDLRLELDNLQSLCKPHHDGAKQALEKSGTMRGHNADGTPIDPSHPWNQ